jgi:hypothetical protein
MPTPGTRTVATQRPRATRAARNRNPSMAYTLLDAARRIYGVEATPSYIARCASVGSTSELGAALLCR